MTNETLEQLASQQHPYPLASCKLGNDNIKNYRIVGDTYYDVMTNNKVINVLEYALNNRVRLRLYLGDRETGRDWEETYDVQGYIGRTTGFIHELILLPNSRSIGGSCILTDCIVKIETSKGKKELYKHPNYHKENSS